MPGLWGLSDSLSCTPRRWMAEGAFRKTAIAEDPPLSYAPLLIAFAMTHPPLQLQQGGALRPSGVPLRALLSVGTSSNLPCKCRALVYLPWETWYFKPKLRKSVCEFIPHPTPTWLLATMLPSGRSSWSDLL